MISSGAEIKVSGVVQGVGYRYFCYRKAIALGLTGFVENKPDRTVLVMVEGDRETLTTLIEELKIGPPSSSVSSVDVRWLSFTGKYRTFEVTIHR